MAVSIEAGSTYTDKPMLLHRSVFDTGSVTFSNETSEGAGLNCLEDTTFDYWDTNVASANVSVDYGSAVYCDAVGIDAHTIGTDGASAALEYSDDNIAWSNAWSHTPSDNTCIIGIFPLTKARYWRLVVYGGPALIGVLKLGRRVIIPTGVLSGHVGVNYSRRVELLSNDSITGQFIGTRIIREGAETTINFGQLDKEYSEDNLYEFVTDYNDGKAFFYAGSPTMYPFDIGYCKRPPGGMELQPPYVEGGTMMEFGFDVQVFADGTSGRDV